MRFVGDTMGKAFDAMQKDAKKKGSTLAEKQARQLKAIARNVSKKVAPTDADIDAVLAKYGRRIKRKKGKTVEQEIERRKKKVGVMSKIWVTKNLVTKTNSLGIPIVNKAGYSAKQDAKHNILKRAMNHQGAAFQKALNRYAEKVTKGFK